MILGSTTRFSQSEPLKWLPYAQDIGVEYVRDGVFWGKITPSAGEYVFEGSNVLYPTTLDAADVDLLLLFGRPLAHADGGTTPHSDAGRKEYAEFVSAVLDQFPSVKQIELGNEFNGNNFVTGTVKKAGYNQRDEYYVELLKAVHDKLEKTHPDVEIIGGATHSIPVGYFRNMFDQGALEYSDGVAIHPYTSTPEHIGDQIDLLRDAMGANQQPIYVTEFSQNFDSPDEAPHYLVKMASAMAAAGVEAATWFMLRETKYWPNRELIASDGTPTDAGKAFQFMQELLDRGPAVDVTPQDGLVRAVSFGNKAMVLWGPERTLTLDSAVKAYSATGELLKGTIKTDPDEPVVLISSEKLKLGGGVKLGSDGPVGDVFMQFDVTNFADGSERFEGPWSWHYARGNGEIKALETVEGGQRPGSIWKPYLGFDKLHPINVTEEGVRPIDFSNGNNPKARYSILERYTADQAMTVRIEGRWDVSDQTTDGVDLTVYAGGDRIFRKVIKDSYDLTLTGIELAEGDTIDFELGVNVDSKGDSTARTIQIFRTGDGASGGGDGGSDAPPPPPPLANDAPVVVSTPGRMLRYDEGATGQLNVAKYFSDPDGDRLSFALEGDAPDFARIEGTNLILTPGASDSGRASIFVKASDGNAFSDAIEIMIAVRDTIAGGDTPTDGDTPSDGGGAPDPGAEDDPAPDQGGGGSSGSGANTAPVASGAPGRTLRYDEGSTSTLNLGKYFSDADGDDLSFVFEEAPGYASIDGDILVLDPGANDSGKTTIRVKAFDGEAYSDEIAIKLAIRDTIVSDPEAGQVDL